MSARSIGHAMLWAALAMGPTATAFAGGGPENVLVVVNNTSPLSQEVGLTYAHLRGIAERQILHLTNVTTQNMQLPIFSNAVRNVIFDYLAATGLTNQIDYVVFAPALPYRVHDNPFETYQHSSLTSCMYYDFYASPNAITAECDLATAASNAYFGADRAFAHADTPGGRYLISGLLYAWNGDEARRLVRRAWAAESTQATGGVYLLHTTDNARNVRWPHFEEADFRSRAAGTANAWHEVETNTLAFATGVLGYLTGLPVVTGVQANTYLPGAYEDHLTSYGGFLIDAPSDQMSMLEWIRAGAAGTYGTIVEPCNFTEKFVDPLLYARYERGFNLGESLYMSVEYPYQGVFVGDPLCAPYVVTPRVDVTEPAPDASVSGLVTVRVVATATSEERPVDRVDVYVDDLWAATLTNFGPRAGNVFRLSVNNATCTYTTVDGDTLYGAATGLAAAANAALSAVSAGAYGDTVQLVHTNFGVLGLTNVYGAFAIQGTADVLNVSAGGVGAQFVDSVFPARKFLQLRGSGSPGGTVRCVVTLTNGVAVTNSLTPASGESASNALRRMMGLINSNATLQATNGVVARYHDTTAGPTTAQCALEVRSPGPRGYNLLVAFTVASGSGFNTGDTFSNQHFNDNGDVLRPRALVRLREGVTNLAVAWVLDTATLPDGPHTVRAVACDGTAVRAQGYAVVPFSVANLGVACTLARPAAGQYFARGVTATAEVGVAGAAGVVTQVTLFVEGKPAGVDTTAPYVMTWSTAAFGVGPLGVQARADTDAGESVLSERHEIVVYTDLDGDGMSDQWEYDRLGSATNYDGTSDPDGDEMPNVGEFLADTDPSNAASRLAITGVGDVEGPTPFALAFGSHTTRVYRVGLQDGSLAETPWSAATGAFSAVEGTTTWTDAATNAPPATNYFRLYRVSAGLP